MPEPTATATAAPPPPASRPRVLLVEDDLRLGQMVEDYLNNAGWAVRRATTLAQ